jgi:hypothetical protein
MTRYRSRFGARGKYNAQKTAYRGETYDSKAEAGRAFDLDLLLAAGQTTAGRRGQRYVLAPACARPDGRRDPAITYRPDFEVRRGDEVWLEDVKGRVTEGFRLKLRWWWRLHPDLPLWLVRADGSRSRV